MTPDDLEQLLHDLYSRRIPIRIARDRSGTPMYIWSGFQVFPNDEESALLNEHVEEVARILERWNTHCF
jgi:hypothetical protein